MGYRQQELPLTARWACTNIDASSGSGFSLCRVIRHIQGHQNIQQHTRSAQTSSSTPLNPLEPPSTILPITQALGHGQRQQAQSPPPPPPPPSWPLLPPPDHAAQEQAHMGSNACASQLAGAGEGPRSKPVATPAPAAITALFALAPHASGLVTQRGIRLSFLSRFTDAVGRESGVTIAQVVECLVRPLSAATR